MLQAFLAWDTSHVLSMGPCGDDHRQPRRCGQSCSPGCTGCHRVTPCLGVADPRGPSRTHLAVVLQRLVRATDPKFRRGHAPRHSIRADSRALDPSPARPTVLLPLPTHGRPSPRVVENAPQTASTAPAGADRAPSGASSRPGHPDPPDSRHRRGHSARPGACPSRRGHSTPSGTAIPSPNARNVPGRTEMSPAAAPECGVFMPRPKTPVRRAGFDCRYSPPRQGVTRLLAGTRMAPVIYCTRVGCHWRRVGCTPGRWDLRAVRTTPGQ